MKHFDTGYFIKNIAKKKKIFKKRDNFNCAIVLRLDKQYYDKKEINRYGRRYKFIKFIDNKINYYFFNFKTSSLI